MASFIALVFFLAALSAVSPLPNVKFYNYLPNGNREELDFNNLHIHRLNQGHRKIKVICHGWMGSIESDWYNPTARAYINAGERNVIAIDWGTYAGIIYPDAVDNVFKVGEYVGGRILELQQIEGIPFEEFHLIGHSLGAHVMGMAGQYIASKTGVKVGRITGLDPAGPSFDSKDVERRLSADDAYFVDVIHTNTLFLGYKSSMGHIDFWPNSGRDQSGCNGDLSCSHNIAPEFFAESINSTSFPAWYCDSTEMFEAGECFDNRMIYMGDLAPSNVRGEFFLNTNPESPYGISVEEYLNH